MDAMKKKKKFPAGRLIVAGAAILALIAVLLLAFGRADADADEGTDNNTTAKATVMDLENTLTSDGEITGSLEEELSPHTSYYLEEIKVEAGDALEEGDTILTYTNGGKMKAPYNCVVEEWSLPDEEEQLTTDHYVKVCGTDVLQMELSVGEDQIALVREGEDAEITVSASSSLCEGLVTSVSQVGDYSSSGSTFTAVVSFDNDGSIKLGMSGTAAIVLEEADKALCVPLSAVSSSGGESKVTLQKEDGSTEEVTVSTGISNDAYIQITDGLSEGDTVVYEEEEDDSSGGGFMNGPGGGGMMPGGNSGGGNGGPGGDGSGGPPDRQ